MCALRGCERHARRFIGRWICDHSALLVSTLGLLLQTPISPPLTL